MTQDLSVESRADSESAAVKRALREFYSALAHSYAETDSGDSDPIETERFQKAAEAFVAHWVELNAPVVIDDWWIQDAGVRARCRPGRDGTYLVEFSPADDRGNIVGGWSCAEDGAIRSNGFETTNAAFAYMAMVKAGADLYSTVEIVKKMCIPREQNE